jgi:hypothetical protein
VFQLMAALSLIAVVHVVLLHGPSGTETARPPGAATSSSPNSRANCGIGAAAPAPGLSPSAAVG